VGLDIAKNDVAEGTAADQSTVARTVKEGDIGDSLVQAPAAYRRKRAYTAEL
jgi:hypothetical protein